MQTAQPIKLTRTYGSNYNGSKLWARVYLPHGALKVNAQNIGETVRNLLLQDSLALSVDLASWRIDYNQNGIYFESFDVRCTEAELVQFGYKRSKSAA